jgi:hypothetical protein
MLPLVHQGTDERTANREFLSNAGYLAGVD